MPNNLVLEPCLDYSMDGGNIELRERMTRLEALISGTNDGENLVDLVTQIQRVKAEFTLTKEVMN